MSYPNACAFAAAAALLGGATAPARAGLLPVGRDRAKGEALLQQATLAYQNGDLIGALRLLEQADAAKPDQADAWNLRGVIYLKQKGYNLAQSAFDRAVAIDPNLWAAQFNLAEMWFQKKDYARARSTFDHLLAQTNRFKTTSKWELVLYKVVLCEILSGDDAAAHKTLAKLPATGATTPASAYSKAAMAFNARNPAEANRILSAAQKSHSAEMNDLFASSLQTAGWQAAPPSTSESTAVASVDPATAAAMNAMGLTNPNGASAPSASRGTPGPALIVDPRLIAANAPLPGGSGSTVMPVSGKNTSSSAKHPAKEQAAATPIPAPVIAGPTAPPPSPLEHEGLLLGLD